MTCGSGWALTKVISEPPAILSGHDAFVLQVTLVPHEDDLGIVPGVGLDLCSPVESWTWRGRLQVGEGRTKACGTQWLASTHQSCTAVKDSWLEMSYMSRKPMAPR